MEARAEPLGAARDRDSLVRQPAPDMDAPVLTGATGYMGGRLLRHFEGAGRPVRCFARNPEHVRATRSTTEVAQGDCLDEGSLDVALAGVDSAYYLVHSMSVARWWKD